MSYRKPLMDYELLRAMERIRPLKEAFDYVADSVIITDTHGNILYANKAVEDKTGFCLQEMIGKNPGDLWGGHTSKKFYQRMWRIVKDKKRPFSGVVRNHRKNGRGYWEELHISPILDEEGNAAFFIGIEFIRGQGTISSPALSRA